MSISRDEVKHIANLSRLTLADEEIESYLEQLNKILGFVKKLDELNTDNVEPTSHVLKISNVFREDKVRDSLTTEMVSQNAPDWKDGQFKVPKVMEG
ncbi:asparaginyl/glutamyl-tRNA amidotransferase subunit C [Vulcanibacillus modesticaldus]|uniref:Aspartyl/glutamyl-tRNA(Asn/Gln) amidotransferase subunit C n=1 Tax=Vulcanibacillus modesticaldus TaxID=337097 RepID=A0A1D2YUC3_9BACI|nr:Asp-tRNA(Asn)/Glu-tRNA(Gln) amidotransferase subunit GatC [Vulcanibacillus modesticaldus]OEF99245.1 asparaginyl/glutamyl-tRNA amidotransferase subunit C [Vulcanibacillus modesticaldus]